MQPLKKKTEAKIGPFHMRPIGKSHGLKGGSFISRSYKFHE
jgi:hypothetical protein